MLDESFCKGCNALQPLQLSTHYELCHWGEPNFLQKPGDWQVFA